MPGKPEPPISDSLPLIECDLPLGRPGLVAHNELLLSGWAASPKGIAGIAVQIGERQWNASYGLDTPALAGRLRDLPDAARAGYRLQLDTSRWEPGEHYVTIAAFDREGGRSAVEGQVEVRPFGEPGPQAAGGAAALDGDEVTISVDPPLTAGACEIEGPLEVSGWAHAAEGIEAVVVTLDGSVQYEALRPVVRPDLLERLGREVAEGAGFALRLAPSDCAPGRHTLTIAATSLDGRTAGVECDVVCAPARATVATGVAPEADGGGTDGGDGMSGDVVPVLRGDRAELDDEARMWESRVLLAEADAALSRAEARLAMRAQEATLRALREAEAQLGTDGRSPPSAAHAGDA